MQFRQLKTKLGLYKYDREWLDVEESNACRQSDTWILSERCVLGYEQLATKALD